MLVTYIGKTDKFGCINGKQYKLISEDKYGYCVVDETGEEYMYQKKNFEKESEHNGKK